MLAMLNLCYFQCSLPISTYLLIIFYLIHAKRSNHTLKVDRIFYFNFGDVKFVLFSMYFTNFNISIKLIIIRGVCMCVRACCRPWRCLQIYETRRFYKKNYLLSYSISIILDYKIITSRSMKLGKNIRRK